MILLYPPALTPCTSRLHSFKKAGFDTYNDFRLHKYLLRSVVRRGGGRCPARDPETPETLRVCVPVCVCRRKKEWLMSLVPRDDGDEPRAASAAELPEADNYMAEG